MKYIIDICYLHKHKHSQIDVDTGMHVNKSNELSDTNGWSKSHTK